MARSSALQRAADERKQKQKIMNEKRKKNAQERIIAEHLERSNFCNFKKPPKCTSEKENNESNKQSQVRSQPK